jgi:hypothetical protein
LLSQSVAELHALPGTQRVQVTPPQSASLSSWFCTLSVHVGAAHAPFAHTRLVQSFELWHFLALPHGPQRPPPQSVSVSDPFATPSTHVAVWHTVAVHTLL